MWRTLLSVLLSAILGSALATAIYTFWLSIWQGGSLPNTAENLRMAIAVFVAASWFTIPGAILLSAVEFALSERVPSDRALDGAVLILGAFTGAAILGGLSLRDAPADWALLGGFYGLTTAILFVLFQRQLGSRRERRL
jgi:hypothetical protein